MSYDIPDRLRRLSAGCSDVLLTKQAAAEIDRLRAELATSKAKMSEPYAGREPWTWAKGTPLERAQMVRSHAAGTRPLSSEALRSLFCLSDRGLAEILGGGDWRPEYQEYETTDPNQREARR